MERLYTFHFHKNPPTQQEQRVKFVTGVWWNKAPIKRGMALKISHPLYPAKWYLDNLQEQGYNVNNANHFRDHYMKVEDIILFHNGEVVLVGPQFTYQTKRNGFEDVRNNLGYRKLEDSNALVTIRLKHIKERTYIHKFKGEHIDMVHWAI